MGPVHGEPIVCLHGVPVIMRSFERTRDKRDLYVRVLGDDRYPIAEYIACFTEDPNPADALMLQYIRAVASIVR